MDLIKFKTVEKKTTKKNKKIIFIVKSNLNVRIFVLRQKIPKQQNNNRFKLINKLPRTKLTGKKAKVRFVNNVRVMLGFCLCKIIIIPH